MKITTRSIIASLLIGTISSAAHAQSSCEDDPRLHRIADFVALKAQGEVEPMQTTAATFLSLTPATREALGSDILVFDGACNANQILQGAPATRIEVPFITYYNGLYNAAVNEDAQSAQLIRTSFRPEPVDLEDFVPMLSAINAPPIVRAHIALTIGVAEYDETALVGDNTQCDNPVNFLTYADVFTAGGGTVSSKNGHPVLALSILPNGLMDILPGNLAMRQPSVGAIASERCILDSGRVSALAVKAGLSVYLHNSLYVREFTRAEIETWIARREGGDNTPVDVSTFQ